VQFPMVDAVGLATLLACRILLGTGERPGLQWFPDEKRTLPTPSSPKAQRSA
jgi:hypothetical protein